MTPLKDVFMISVTDNLDFDDLKAIYTSGYTRIPVYHNRRDCIVGIVFTKDLILVDPNDEIPVASILPFCSRPLNAASKGTSLEHLLTEMQTSRSHLYFVTDSAGPLRKKLPRVERVVGIVTMEDLIEELISIEIIDESDVITDNVYKKKVRVGYARAPVETPTKPAEAAGGGEEAAGGGEAPGGSHHTTTPRPPPHHYHTTTPPSPLAPPHTTPCAPATRCPRPPPPRGRGAAPHVSSRAPTSHPVPPTSHPAPPTSHPAPSTSHPPPTTLAQVTNRSQRRLEFFEMLQRRDLLMISGGGPAIESRIFGERPTADEVRALASYLSTNVAVFRPPKMSTAVLRKLLVRCSISSVSEVQVAEGKYVYVRGVPASFFCLVLHGRLQIRAGNEGFTSEIGAPAGSPGEHQNEPCPHTMRGCVVDSPRCNPCVGAWLTRLVAIHAWARG